MSEAKFSLFDKIWHYLYRQFVGVPEVLIGRKNTICLLVLQYLTILSNLSCVQNREIRDSDYFGSKSTFLSCPQNSNNGKMRWVECPLSIHCNCDADFIVGEPIILKVTIFNESETLAGFRGFNDGTDSLLKVYLDGHVVAKTERGQRSLVDEDIDPWKQIETQGSSPSNTLPPHGRYTYMIEPTDYYHMEKPGKYFVTIRRRANDFQHNTYSQVITGCCVEVRAKT